MIEIGLGHYLTLGAIIFFLGVMGIFLNRKNVIVILMSVELILLAVNINLISFSIFSGDIVGQIFTMLILTVAAAEAAIGLAIIVSPVSVSIFAEPELISLTVPVKVLFSPIKLATKEFTGVSYNSFGPESC